MLDQKDLELLAGMINPINVQLGNINNRLDGIDARLDAVDTRLDGIDARLDAMDVRLDGIDARLDAMDVRFDEIDARFNRVENRLEMIDLKCDTNAWTTFHWMLSLQNGISEKISKIYRTQQKLLSLYFREEVFYLTRVTQYRQPDHIM